MGQSLLIFKASLSHSRHAILGRTTLDKRSARRTDLYLTTHNTHKRHTSVLTARLEPTLPASEQPQTRALDHAATAIGRTHCTFKKQTVTLVCPPDFYQEFYTEVFKQYFMHNFCFPADVLYRPTPRIKIVLLS
jgi:hypothetical protein